MPPPSNSVMRIAKHYTKGGNTPPDTSEVIETMTHEPITTIATTIKEAVTTVMNSISSTVQETFVPGGVDANTNTNNTLPADEGGATEMGNSTNTDIANMNMTFNQEGPGSMLTSTGTSLEVMTTTLMDGMEHMEHVDESDGYNGILFIILGIVLGVLVIVAAVLAVVYNHYKKRGFEEITGEQSTADPKSMKQLQQASSQDALLDK